MAGGELRAHDGGAFGAEAIAFVRRFQVDYAICSATAINADRGFMLSGLQEAEFSREIMQRANTRIVAADSTKFGHGGPIVVCDPSMVDKLVTDAPPPADLCTAMDAWSLEIIVADTDATGAAKGLLPDDHARRGRRRGPLPCCPRGATTADRLVQPEWEERDVPQGVDCKIVHHMILDHSRGRNHLPGSSMFLCQGSFGVRRAPEASAFLASQPRAIGKMQSIS